jgi:starch synthase
MKKKRQIFHITTETVPFYKRGGMGDVVGALPNYLENEENHNIVICLYHNRKIKHLDNSIIEGHSFDYGGIQYDYFSFYTNRNSIDYYFIKLADAAALDEMENNNGNLAYSPTSSIIPYFYFGKAVLQLIIDLELTVDYIFCHDWQTAGFFGYPGIIANLGSKSELKTVFVIHNFEFQGILYEDIYPYLEREVARELESIFLQYGCATMAALALKNSDYVATVSHSYARELIEMRSPHTGLMHLDLCNREILSFLNGSDLSLWKPENNPFLPLSFSLSSFGNKKKLKQMVLAEFGFDDEKNTAPPLVLMLCRLTAQKGIGLFIDYYKDEQTVVANMANFLEQDVRFIICGQPGGGLNGIIDSELSDLSKKFQGKFVYLNNYKEELAHKLLAAADILIAPSLFEPCGLIQIYAMSFGVVPVVRSVGGMKDTVCCYFENPEKATGFYLNNFSWHCLFTTMRKAIDLYYNQPDEWREIIERGMRMDFSWNRMKDQYFRFFTCVEHDPTISFERLSQMVKVESVGSEGGQNNV